MRNVNPLLKITELPIYLLKTSPKNVAESQRIRQNVVGLTFYRIPIRRIPGRFLLRGSIAVGPPLGTNSRGLTASGSSIMINRLENKIMFLIEFSHNEKLVPSTLVSIILDEGNSKVMENTIVAINPLQQLLTKLFIFIYYIYFQHHSITVRCNILRICI